MSFQKIEGDSYCVGGRHRCATTKIYGDTTCKDSKVLFGYCSLCMRKKSMEVSDKTIQVEGFGYFFTNLGKKAPKVSKKMAKHVLKNPSRALYITANIATAGASKNPKL